jgi:hypothetical protein
MAKINLDDYELIASNKSKPLNMDEYEVIEQPTTKTENPYWTLGIPFTNLKYDFSNTPVKKVLDPVISGLTGFNTQVAKTFTGGAIDPEQGRIRVPLTNIGVQVTKPMDEALQEKDLNQTAYDVGTFAGQTAGDLALISGINKFVSSPVLKQLAKKFPTLNNPKLVTQVLSGALTAPGFTAIKKAIEEGRTPTAQEFGTDLAFFAASPLGGELTKAGLNKVAPKLPNLIKAPLEGAAEGVTGLLASTPFMNDEQRKNMLQEVGPTALAQALFKTAGSLGNKGVKLPIKANEKITDINMPIEQNTPVAETINAQEIKLYVPSKPVKEMNWREIRQHTENVLKEYRKNQPVSIENIPFDHPAEKYFETQFTKSVNRGTIEIEGPDGNIIKIPGVIKSERTGNLSETGTNPVSVNERTTQIGADTGRIKNQNSRGQQEIRPSQNEAVFDSKERFLQQVENEQKIKKSEEFKKWFKGSKIVDRNGEPILLYHGTNNNFNMFDLSKQGTSTSPGLYGSGFYFTEYPGEAKAYAGEKGKVISAYVDIKNPLDAKEFNKKYEKVFENYKKEGNKNGSLDDLFREALIKDGYDGVISYDSNNKIYEVNVLYPEQIKIINQPDQSRNLSPIGEIVNKGEMIRGKSDTVQTQGADLIRQNSTGINQGRESRPNNIQSNQEIKPPGKVVSVSVRGQKHLQKAGLTAEEAIAAINAQKNGIEWFKEQFPEIKEFEKAYNELANKFNKLTPKEQSQVKFDLQFFAAMRDPLLVKEVKKKLIEKYGTIKPGELPRLRDIEIPAETEAGVTRKFARTAAEILPEETSKTILEGVTKDKFAYEPISNKSTIEKAVNEVNESFDSAYKKWQGAIASGKRITAQDIALGEALLTEAAKKGDIKKAEQLTIDLASELTNAGQTVQSARILKKMSPEGFSIYMERQLDRVNRELKQKYGDKVQKLKLTESERKALLEAPNRDAREEIGLQIASRLAKQLPVSFMEKFNSWRRLAMLFNPKTHIRNIIGNALSIPMRKLADTYKSGLEKVFKPNEKTVGFGWQKNNKIVDIVNTAWKENKNYLKGSGRWEINKVLNQEKPIFKPGIVSKSLAKITNKPKIAETGILETVNKFSKETLEMEDTWFLEREFKDALGQYLKANNLTKVNDKAINFATKRALEITYRDSSATATMLNNIKAKGGFLGTVVESLMPFTKTLINIAKRGIEYSPAGLIKGIVEQFNLVSNGKATTTEVLENLSKGLSGTTVMTLAIFLAKLGILTGAEDPDIDKAEFDRSIGKQPFAVNINGKYYTYDWAQPFAIPIALGTQIYLGIKEKEGLVNSILNSAASGIDVFLNVPVFQGVKKTLKGFSISEEYGTESAAQALFDIFDSYARQAIPTLGGQIAKTIDQTVRTTWTPKTEKGIPAMAGNRATQFSKYLMSRTPGLSQKLPAKINTLGEEVKQSPNPAARAFQNFFSPGNFSQYKTSPGIKMIEEIYKQTEDARIYPRIAPKNFTINNEKINLTSEERSRFQQIIGQQVLSKLNFYAGANRNKTNEQKIKDIRKILDDAYDNAKNQLIKEKGIKLKPKTTKPKSTWGSSNW